MGAIITTSDLQKKIGTVAKAIGDTVFTVTNRGKAKMVILPYFPENEAALEDYLEAYELERNRIKLQKKYDHSWASGLSDLRI